MFLQGGGEPQVDEVTGAYVGKPACPYNLSLVGWPAAAYLAYLKSM